MRTVLRTCEVDEKGDINGQKISMKERILIIKKFGNTHHTNKCETQFICKENDIIYRESVTKK